MHMKKCGMITVSGNTMAPAELREVLTAALMQSKDGARSNSRKPRRSKRIKRANELLVKEPEPLAPNPVAASTLEQARCTLINLIKAHAREDRYAALLSRALTPEAKTLVRSVFGSFIHWQLDTRKRVRKYGEKTGKTYHDAIERFIGDLLRAKGDTRSSGRIFHPTGATTFDDVPVGYDVFMGMLAGLTALGFVGIAKGSMGTRRATTFWATEKLIDLATQNGVRLQNIRTHFKPEPPHNPLVMRGRGERRGNKKTRGTIIKKPKRDETVERMEMDLRELNAFLADCEIIGGDHEGYTRNFNVNSWKRGGRLYSIGGGYQQMSPPEKRLEMTINGEPVAEIDIRASHLTIIHAKLEQPLSRDSDPYERIKGFGVDRSIAKLWTVIGLGSAKPPVRWPAETAKKYQKDTGKVLGKVARVKDVGKAMLKAFPTLRKVTKLKVGKDLPLLLQFTKSEAVVSTMLILMRDHHIPSLSTHDGIVVPRSGVGWTKAILTQQYLKSVGVEPVLTVEPKEADYFDATEL
jgi:hypothetical protein